MSSMVRAGFPERTGSDASPGPRGPPDGRVPSYGSAPESALARTVRQPVASSQPGPAHAQLVVHPQRHRRSSLEPRGSDRGLHSTSRSSVCLSPRSPASRVRPASTAVTTSPCARKYERRTHDRLHLPRRRCMVLGGSLNRHRESRFVCADGGSPSVSGGSRHGKSGPRSARPSRLLRGWRDDLHGHRAPRRTR